MGLLRKYKSLYSSTATSFGTGTGVTITPASVTGLPTTTEITLTFDRVSLSGVSTPGVLERIIGTISGGNFVVRTSPATGRGADNTTEQAHTSPVVEMIWNAKDLNDIIDFLLLEHNTDGTHNKINGNAVPAGTDTVALIAASQILTNKSVQSSTISTGTKVDANADPNVTLYGMSRQALINSNFDVWQRGTSFAAAGYTADRWKIVRDGSGATVAVSRQSFTLGQTDVPNEPTYFSRFAQSVAGTGATYNQFNQCIEGVRSLAGQTVTVSFYAKAAAPLTLGIKYMQYFGSGGSPSTALETDVQNVSVTTGWQKFTVTTTIPSIGSKVLGSNNNDYLQLMFNLPINTTFTFDLAQVQLCKGDVALPFQPKSLADELKDCQRYYEKSYPINIVPGTNTSLGRWKASGTSDSGGNMTCEITFKVTKRGSPTMKYYTETGVADKWNTGRSGTSGDYTTTSFGTGDAGTEVYAPVGASWAAAELQGQWVADADF